VKGSKLKLRVRHDFRNGIDRPRLVSSYRDNKGKTVQKHWASVYLWPKKYIDGLKVLILEHHRLVLESNRSDIPRYDRQKAAKEAGKVLLRIEGIKKGARIAAADARALNDRRRLGPITGRRKAMQESHDVAPVVAVFDRLGKARVALERTFEGVDKWDAQTRESVREQIVKFKEWLNSAEAKIR